MKKLGAELKRHALTAISYMLPLVVASGLLIAFLLLFLSDIN